MEEVVSAYLEALSDTQVARIRLQRAHQHLGLLPTKTEATEGYCVTLRSNSPGDDDEVREAPPTSITEKPAPTTTIKKTITTRMKYMEFYATRTEVPLVTREVILAHTCALVDRAASAWEEGQPFLFLDKHTMHKSCIAAMFIAAKFSLESFHEHKITSFALAAGLRPTELVHLEFEMLQLLQFDAWVDEATLSEYTGMLNADGSMTTPASLEPLDDGLEESTAPVATVRREDCNATPPMPLAATERREREREVHAQGGSHVGNHPVVVSFTAENLSQTTQGEWSIPASLRRVHSSTPHS
ncbi:hypothetical protein Pelo_10442 [Pelomyxa schiedti]|nr:hypothetical protein Pelo_10442 [Pelomyxa schiedti]